MTEPKDLRAGNTDRTHVIEALRAAHADARLSEDELAERIQSTQDARTFGDLDDIVADLPIPAPSVAIGASLQPASDMAVPHGPVGSSPENPLLLDAGWSSEKREGDWEIPQFLRVRGGLGSVRLDCTEARTTHQVVHMWVDGDMGSITVVVPEGWAADAEGLQKSLGSINIKVPTAPTMGRPIFVLNGSMGLGSFTVRPPNWFERKALEKRLR